MRNTGKKIISLIAAGALMGAAFSFAACSDKTYKGDDLTGYVSDAKVESNGGFAVRKATTCISSTARQTTPQTTPTVR